MKTRYLAFWYTGLILLASSLPQPVVQKLSFGTKDFVLHFFEYNLYGLLWFYFWLDGKSWEVWKRYFPLVLLLGGGMGILDEIYQSFIPTRFSTWQDAVADIVGVLFSPITLWLVQRLPWRVGKLTNAD